ALREAIINAVCHRDYFDKRSLVMVEVFENRVEISNPGGLPTGLKPEDFGTKSVARNPLIASLLHRINYIERMGTGISRIRGAVEQHGGCTVEFAHTAFYTTTFRKNNAEEVGEKTSEKHRSNVGEKTVTTRKHIEKNTSATSEKTSEKILRLLQEEPQMTIEKLSKATGVSTRSVERNISTLQNTGRLQRIGAAKGGYWKVVE
ncbi:MAG: HTH domain-containing protein, partial [Candidatus Electrothrix sp. ATG2]|nr:HTH domain-containing protein [Candidatus Electrothrix sp. ATG2]